jgi:peptide-methionine (S)-S-oxide reductase
VVRTRVGYTGGTKANPTYRQLGDHTETVQVDYDPRQVSYENLLRVFWESHNPGVASWSRQYQAAVFYHNGTQKRLALKSREAAAARLKGRVYTEVRPAGEFYPAEDYHQKYFLRQAPELLAEFQAIYPAAGDLINSTAAARVNAYLAGAGSREGLAEEINRLGLSAAGQRQLKVAVAAYGKSEMRHVCPVN